MWDKVFFCFHYQNKIWKKNRAENYYQICNVTGLPSTSTSFERKSAPIVDLVAMAVIYKQKWMILMNVGQRLLERNWKENGKKNSKKKKNQSMIIKKKFSN